MKTILRNADGRATRPARLAREFFSRGPLLKLTFFPCLNRSRMGRASGVVYVVPSPRLTLPGCCT